MVKLSCFPRKGHGGSSGQGGEASVQAKTSHGAKGHGGSSGEASVQAKSSHGAKGQGGSSGQGGEASVQAKSSHGAKGQGGSSGQGGVASVQAKSSKGQGGSSGKGLENPNKRVTSRSVAKGHGASGKGSKGKECERVASSSESPEAEEHKRKRSKAEQRQRQRPKKSLRYTDPFQVEKSRYNLEIFQAVNPFVDLNVIPEGEYADGLGSLDKVDDGSNLDIDMLKAVYEFIDSRVDPTLVSFKYPKTELGGRPIHAAYLSALSYCTRPRSRRKRPVSSYYVEAEDSEKDSEEESELQEDEEDMDDELLEDYEVQAGGWATKEAEADFPTSDDSIVVCTEGDDPVALGSDQVIQKTKYDFKVKVHDRRLGTDVTVLIIECEWDKLGMNKSYQAAGYAMKHVANNLKLGRFKPVYLQTWGATSWRYGIVIPAGLVTVENGVIVEVKGAQLSLKQLQKRLKRETRKLRLKFKMDSYPDGEYVVATTVVFEQLFPFMFHKPYWGQDSAFFLQAMLRIICGNRTKSWTCKDFQEVHQARFQDYAKVKEERLLFRPSILVRRPRPEV